MDVLCSRSLKIDPNGPGLQAVEAAAKNALRTDQILKVGMYVHDLFSVLQESER